jgi:hypothetical protein
LLGNDRNIHAHNNRTAGLKPVSKQRTCKHAAASINLLLETVFSILCIQNNKKKKKKRLPGQLVQLCVGSSVELCKGGLEEMAL